MALSHSLVIGYGNPLRGDDGVGQRVAETVAQWQVETVEVIAVHQLTPDLAASIAQVQRVIFVDAIPTSDPTATLHIQPLTPEATQSWSGHHAHPRSLLALTEALYGATPAAYWLLIPAIDVGFGETLSATAQAGVEQALVVIQRWVDGSHQSSEE